VVEGRERCLGAIAHGDDDLLVGRGRRVAGGEDAGQRSLAARVDLDLAARRELDVPLSQSVFGSRPIWTKMPSSSTRCVAPLTRS
jgi:hypothetical protein